MVSPFMCGKARSKVFLRMVVELKKPLVRMSAHTSGGNMEALTLPI